jgi:hypothetical protein
MEIRVRTLPQYIDELEVHTQRAPNIGERLRCAIGEMPVPKMPQIGHDHPLPYAGQTRSETHFALYQRKYAPREWCRAIAIETVGRRTANMRARCRCSPA